MKKLIRYGIMAALCLFFGRVRAQELAGRVLDETGRGLPGATVQVNELVRTTDSAGRFAFKNVPASGKLQASFVGYESALVAYKAGVALSVSLKPLAGSLDEVLVIGYGETSKRLNTGSVGRVSAEVIGQQPVANPLAALQGRVSGVLVQTQNGLPGGNIKVQVRGQGSLASGTDPLYIIDGVPFLSAPLYTGNTLGANGAISPFSVLNPGDIESMEVLKDADATSIYGSRGANGVVLITTKKGKAGKDVFSVQVDQGWSRVSRFNRLLDLSEYLALRREAFKNDKVVPTATNAPDLMVWDTTNATDWQKYFLGGTAAQTNVQASLAGGDSHTRYLFSSHYHTEGTILPGDERYNKAGGFLSLDHTGLGDRLSLNLSVSYNRDNNYTLYLTNPNAVNTPPDFPVYNADRSYTWTISNPVAGLEKKQRSISRYFNANTALKYKLAAGVDLKLSTGYNEYAIAQVATIPLSSLNPTGTAQATAYFSDNRNERYIFEPQVDVHHRFGDLAMTGLVGGTYQQVKTTGQAFTGTDVNNPDLLGQVSAAGSISAKSDVYSLYRFASVFGRLNLNWQQKYLLNVNVRRDGSSRFGPGKQFGNFWAVGAAWLFKAPMLSFGKLRGSYGTTGNDQISEYQYVSTYSTGATYGTVASLSPSRIANPAYSWETTNKLELALELGFLKDRVLFSAAVYRNRSGNQLLAYAIPYITGFASYQANFPAVVQNSGLELELQTINIKTQQFSWKTSVNLSFQKNKLIDFPDLASSSYASSYVVGEDLSLVKSYQFTGVDPATGLPTFADLDKNGSIAFPADVIIAGKTSPDLFGGLSNTLIWRKLQLDVFIEVVKRRSQGYTPSLGSSALNNPAFVLERWRQVGDLTNVPRATINAANLSNYYTTRFGDASYARLKTVSLAWQAGKKTSVYIRGENLFTLANRDRLDPEIAGNSIGYPPLRTLTCGFKLTF